MAYLPHPEVLETIHYNPTYTGPPSFQAAETALRKDGPDREVQKPIQYWMRFGVRQDAKPQMVEGPTFTNILGTRYRMLRVHGRGDQTPRQVYIKERRGLKEEITREQDRWTHRYREIPGTPAEEEARYAAIIAQTMAWVATQHDRWELRYQASVETERTHLLTHMIWEQRRYLYIGVQTQLVYAPTGRTTLHTNLIVRDIKTPETPHIVLGRYDYQGRNGFRIPTFSTMRDSYLPKLTLDVGAGVDITIVSEAAGELDVTNAPSAFFARRQRTTRVMVGSRWKLRSHRTSMEPGPYSAIPDDHMVTPPVSLAEMSTKADAVPVGNSVLEKERQRRGELKRALAEACFHPDRVMRMESVYGEDWMDSHD